VAKKLPNQQRSRKGNPSGLLKTFGCREGFFSATLC